MNDTIIMNKLEEIKTTLKDNVLEPRLSEFERIMNANQKAIDGLLIDSKNRGGNISLGNFGESFATKIANEFSSKQNEIAAFQNQKDAKIAFNLKASTMTVSNSLTGDGQSSYGQRQGLVPNQKVNFRDIIPSTTSPTGLYVTYRETGGTGSIGEQTEGETKSAIDYDFTEVKTVSGYTAGFARFSKQLMFQLPWLQTTLTRMLLRDFYKKENFKFWQNVAANASGFTTTGETDNAKQIIDILSGRADEDFNNSFILCKNSEVGALLKLLYANGFYMGSGSVVGTPDGNVRIGGTPIIGVSWAATGKIMVLDTDFIERVQTEDIRVEFSYEDSDNFQRNLVTARVECFEDLNLLRTDAHSYVTI